MRKWRRRRRRKEEVDEKEGGKANSVNDKSSGLKLRFIFA